MIERLCNNFATWLKKDYGSLAPTISPTPLTLKT